MLSDIGYPISLLRAEPALPCLSRDLRGHALLTPRGQEGQDRPALGPNLGFLGFCGFLGLKFWKSIIIHFPIFSPLMLTWLFCHLRNWKAGPTYMYSKKHLHLFYFEYNRMKIFLHYEGALIYIYLCITKVSSSFCNWMQAVQCSSQHWGS